MEGLPMSYYMKKRLISTYVTTPGTISRFMRCVYQEGLRVNQTLCLPIVTLRLRLLATMVLRCLQLTSREMSLFPIMAFPRGTTTA